MKYCRECGEKLTDDQRFCPICGTAADDTDQVRPNQSQPEEIVPNEPPKISKKKIWIIVAVCAAILVIAAVFLVLLLTGTFNKCSKKETQEDNTSNQNTDGSEKGQSPDGSDGLYPKGEIPEKASADRVAALENRELKTIVGKTLGFVSSFMDLSFDADVTLVLESNADGSGGLSAADFLNNAKLQLRVDSRNGKDIGASLLLWNNPIIDLRAFDLDKDTVKLYSSAKSDKLYVVPLDSALKAILGETMAGRATLIEYVMQLVFSGNITDSLKPETDAVIDAFTNAISDGEAVILPSETVELFNGQQNTECELYTIRPSKEQIEAFLVSVFDMLENGNGYISKALRYAGFDEDDFRESRANIPKGAQSVYNSGMTFEIAVSGNEIVHQNVRNTVFSLTYDIVRNGSEKHAMIVFESERISFTIETRETAEGKLDLNAVYNNFIRVNGSFDKNQKSLIGTYAGKVDVYEGQYKFASAEIYPGDQSMIHAISIDPNRIAPDLGDDLTVLIEVKAATGVTYPNGAEEVDLADYTVEEVMDVLHSLIAPIETIIAMGMGY